MERPDDNDSQYWFNPLNRGDGIIECSFDHVNYERHLNTFCDYQAEQIKELSITNNKNASSWIKQIKELKEAKIDYGSTLEHLKPHQDKYFTRLIEDMLKKHTKN